MEVLRRIQDIQNELEDALRLEIEYAEVQETKEGKKLLRYLRKRRRAVNGTVKMFKERNYE